MAQKLPMKVDPKHCTICGSMECIELHHISQEPELLIPLCSTCHYRVHHEEGYYDHLNPEMSRNDAKLVRVNAMRSAINHIINRHLEDAKID